MLFTSYEFIAFLLILFAVYYLIPKKYQWMLLLAGSYLYYFYAGPFYLLFILTTTFTVWATGILMTRKEKQEKSFLSSERGKAFTKDEKKAFKAAGKKKRRRIMVLCLLLNLGILAVLKYTNFTINNINGLLDIFGSENKLSFVDLVLPMGISFYTFQAVGYLVDVYRGTVKAQDNFFKFALFVGFFPQLVQGPISRYDDLSKSLYEEHAFDWKNNVSMGLQRILFGFFKKVVIADRMLIAVNEIIGNTEQYTGMYVFLGMIFYAFELYADFTGGIDITIGVAQVLGIKVAENFHRPFFSKSIKEYWRRWHITMGTWFTDYIFYPISVSKGMLKLSKFSRSHFGEALGKRIPVYLSSFVVWFATGFWHGASWNFIVWGIGNYVVIMISQELEPLYRKFHARVNTDGNTAYKIFTILRTFLLMSCLRSFDCYRDVPLTFKMFGTMFTTPNWGILFDGSLMGLGLGIFDYCILAFGLIVLFTVSMSQRKGPVRARLATLPYWIKFAIWFGLFIIILLAGAYGVGYDASQFIYNQF
ncbi:MAG: MBOAT family protein [Lachnospiraceae bacterium]|nr:MBOAT family protein [Candidatus Merdinaster equi]